MGGGLFQAGALTPQQGILDGGIQGKEWFQHGSCAACTESDAGVMGSAAVPSPSEILSCQTLSSLQACPSGTPVWSHHDPQPAPQSFCPMVTH